MDPSLTVVIPTWNHSDLLRECLISLRSQSFRDFSVVVVDDGSTEDIKGAIAGDFPEVVVLRLARNGGFAVAANAGLSESRTPFVFLLNNDMTLDSGCLEELMHVVTEGEAAMAAPLVLWRDDPQTIYSAGDRQRINGRPEGIGFRRPLEAFEFDEQVFGVSAGAALYRREVLDTVGAFDTRFGAYFEDSDLSFRARIAGFNAVCVPGAVAYHVGSASLEGRNLWRARQCYRNHALLVLKNMPGRLLLRYAHRILLEQLHQMGRVLSVGRAESGLARALLALALTRVEIITLVPHALRERRRIRKQRRISVRDLDRLLTR